MSKEELINTIEMAKHDITMRVRAVVLDPIDAMSEDGAATPEYFREQGKKHEDTLLLAKSIMSTFAKKWRDVKSPEDEQLEQLKRQVAYISSDVIPQIEKITKYYKICDKHKYYFSDNEDGNWARTRMAKAISSSEKVCADLKKIGDVSDSVKQATLNLLDLLQDVLDDIRAYVVYKDEVNFSSVEVSTDRDILQHRVLANIQENANRHAFGTRAWKYKHLWEKKVLVTYKKTKDYHVV